jgi:hypothetical protein
MQTNVVDVKLGRIASRIGDIPVISHHLFAASEVLEKFDSMPVRPS